MNKKIIVVSVSGGKDSTALWLYTKDQYDETEWEIRPVFADTGNEHPITMKYLNYLSKEIGPIDYVYPELNFLELAMKKRRFPSAKARFCTEHLKMRPIKTYIDKLKDADAYVEIHVGIRRDESKARSTALEREYSNFYSCDIVRPLADWTIDDVWKIHAKHNIKANPLYAAGFERVGCMPCIHARKSEIKLIAEKYPDVIDKVRRWEQVVTKYTETQYRPFFFVKLSNSPYCCKCRKYIEGDQRKCGNCGGELKMATTPPTIDEVVAWAKTARGGRQYKLFDEQTEIPAVCGVYNLCE